ncbi:MAG: glycosyltransferase [Vulcanimicrobiaceae bacterium]
MLNVAVAVPRSSVPAWHGRCIDALRARADTLQVRVVATDAPAWTPPSGLAAWIAGSALVPVTPQVEVGGFEDADVVLNLTTQSLEVEPPLGVWTFRLDRSDDTAFPFAREIADGAATLEVELLRRRAGLCEPLRSGRFGVMIWHPTTLRNAFRIAAEWPATLAAAAAAGIALEGGTNGDVMPGRPRPLDALERTRFGVRLARRLAAWTLQQLFRVEGWEVALLAGDARSVLSDAPLDVRWILASNREGFSADPFPFARDGQRAIFFEAYDYERHRGVIDAVLLDGAGSIARRGRILEEATHLSYPCPFEAEGELYIVAENYASGEVPLYRCVDFPWRWERQPPLFTGFDGVDTTLFEHAGRWWAICTRYSHGSTLALYAFHAASFRGPWTAHALNPVVVDVGSARPAGRPFVVDGVLYRPGQDCSRSYGGGLVIARVDALTPTEYRETIVRWLDGSALRPPRAGMHTLNFVADLAVVDAKRVSLDPFKRLRRLEQLGRRMHKLRVAAASNGKPHALPVVHVCAQLGSYGAENVVVRLMLHTPERDAALVAMTIGPWTHPEVRDKLDFPIVEIRRRGRFDFFFLMRMVGELRRLRPDVVHTHGHHGRYWGRLAAVLAGVPLIVHTEHNSELAPPSPRSLFGALNRWLAPRTTAFVTFNQLRQAELSAAEHVAIDRISVIPNGIPIQETGPEARERVRRELGLDAGDVAILMLVRLATEKRLDIAFDALAALPDPWRARARLIVVGDGPLRAELKGQTERLGLTNRVRFLGFRSDASELLAGADVLLLTSAREAMPLAIVEAMVARVPVVSVPWKGAVALLEGGRLGLVTASYEPAEVAASIAAVFEDPGAALARATAASELARAEYDVTTQARRYTDLYRRLSAATRSARSRIPAARS